MEDLEVEPDILVFLNGYYRDYSEHFDLIVAPILMHGYDIIFGSDTIGNKESESMILPQVFGNCLAASLIKTISKTEYFDLRPFRAIKWDIESLGNGG